MDAATRVLAAGISVAPSRGYGAGCGAVPTGDGRGAATRPVGDGGAYVSVVALVVLTSCGLLLALGFRLRRLRYRRAAWTVGIGLGVVAGRGTARAAGDRGLRGGAQPPRMDRLVVASAARLTSAGSGPAAQQGRGGPVLSARCSWASVVR